MRLLIAGWHGQVARALIELAPSRSEIKALAAGRPALDVRDPRSIERAFGDLSPTVVINTAAYTAVDQAETDPDAAFALNRDGARLLAQAAARRNVPLIHLSTHYVFDGTKQAPYDESDEPCPATVYGRSKLAGEAAVRAANPHHVIIRTGWVFGPAGQNFATRIMGAAVGGAPLRVVSDQRGNPTYAPHLAAAILDLAGKLTADTRDTPVWGTYHAAGTGAASWLDLASEILACAAGHGTAGAPLEPIASADYPARASRPINSELDCTLFARTFGFSLPPWQQGVAACVERLVSA
ncbi:dTDP-4-dehydrorhamnose reductase [Hyphomicrobium sp.]|uniref:dTDP-4-dehydrorhamnose reductase n=1 Tax=Hyphomicrobium sp. TaxID=82 RepID=UPI0025C02DEF|nr:dTDP-4-dehydrorhamnose reductase [Hyphomicrobium sp.]MCC7252968.1 dTDP-4-dehydrorhamnose reductase [Hyphomicrobium sp.]